MPSKRVDPSKGQGGDDRAEQNREFGSGDQEFGGGKGDLEYGEPPARELEEEPIRNADTGVEDAAEEQARERGILGEEADDGDDVAGYGSPPDEFRAGPAAGTGTENPPVGEVENPLEEEPARDEIPQPEEEAQDIEGEEE